MTNFNFIGPKLVIICLANFASEAPPSPVSWSRQIPGAMQIVQDNSISAKRHDIIRAASQTAGRPQRVLQTAGRRWLSRSSHHHPVQTDKLTDRQTDRQTDRRPGGPVRVSPRLISGSAPASQPLPRPVTGRNRSSFERSVTSARCRTDGNTRI